MKKTTLGILICWGLAPMLAPAAEEGSFWISAGPVVRGGMQIGTSGSSHVQELGLRAARDFLPAPQSGAFRETGRTTVLEGSTSLNTAPAAIGASGAFANRTYDDGYDNMDGCTTDPASFTLGMTWFWGYDDADQYDAGAGTLELHARGTQDQTDTMIETVTLSRPGQSIASTVQCDREFSQEQDAQGVGLGIEGGWIFHARRGLEISLAVGLNALFGVQADFQGSTWSERIQNQSWTETMTQVARRTTTATSTTLITDQYDVSGISPSDFPGEGHHGTYDGPWPSPGTPSPTIPNTPVTRTQTPVDVIASSSTTVPISTTVERGPIRTEELEAANHVQVDVDATVWQLWLGPQAAWQLADRWNLHLTPAVSLNCLSVSVNRMEQFTAIYSDGRRQTFATWKDDNNETLWAPGLMLDCGVEYELNGSWSVGVFARYDLIQEVDLSSGPADVTLDASGYSIGAMLKRGL